MVNNNRKFRRDPPTISGRAFSNGVFLSGGGVNVLSVTTKNGEIVTEKYYDKAGKTVNIKIPVIRGAVKMLSAAVSGVKYSAKAFKRNRKPSLIRMFKYHGAEHKVIHCYEKGEELTFDNVRKQPTYHPRCGTSVAANTLIAEALILCFVPGKVGRILGGAVDYLLLLSALGIGYETSRYAAYHKGRCAKAFALPGKLAQKVTALEPDEDMIMCGIQAAKAVIKRENEL